MKCKACDAELEDGVTICPGCGADNSEAPVQEEIPAQEAAVEAPAQEVPAEDPPVQESEKEEHTPIVEGKLTPGKIALLVILAVAAVAVVIALIVGGLSSGTGTDLPSESTVPATDGTVATTEATIPAAGNPDDVTCKGSYTVTDEEVAAARENVVATMGDTSLTNGQLQVYYWMQFYDFLDAYGSYASYFGLDYTQPLDTQLSLDGTSTWQQYLLSGGLDMWQTYEAMCQKAKADGYELPQEYEDYLAALPETLESTAASSGFESALAMIQADMGAGVQIEDYAEYLRDYYLGYAYYAEQLAAIQLTDADVEAYFDENAESYAESGIEKDDSKYVDVRHILVMPQGGTTDDSGNTTYSDAEWEACRASAQAILDEWLAGEQTEDRFAELAGTYSEDGGSNTNGGLYEDVMVGEMVEPFENWCFDEARVVGDYGLVQTTYGYHVMYYVGSESIWHATAWDDLMTQKGNELINSALEAFPAEIDYSAIVLGLVDFSG